MKKIISSIILLVCFFYTIYPQALEFRGSSIVSLTGIIGLVFFLIKGDFFDEVLTILKGYVPFVLTAALAGFIAGFYDPYLYSFSRSQIGWLFTAYLLVFLFFKVFQKGSLNTFLLFIIGAICLQCICSVLMHEFPAVNSFLSSLAMQTDLDELKRGQTEDQRLLGYGVAFFGAGLICGVALIFIIYILMSRKQNVIQLSILVALYVFIFYIGLLNARTTVVGLLASIALLAILLWKGKKVSSMQGFKFIGISLLFLSIGYTLCYIYFPEFSDWAFELFTNYQKTGELRTNSSDGIEHMFILPSEVQIWLFGRGGMAFWGSDVGYTRLLFYFGLPGTIAFFYYPYIMSKMCESKDVGFNWTLVVLFIYNLALNVKGLSDLNIFMYLIVFYFIFKKYYTYQEYQKYLKYQKRIHANKLRYAIQS